MRSWERKGEETDSKNYGRTQTRLRRTLRQIWTRTWLK